MQQQKKRGDRAGHVQHELHHVRPDHRAHSAFKRIKHRQHGDDQNRNALARSKRHAHHFADGRYPHALRQRASPHENHRRHRSHARPESLFQKLVGGVEFALEILWDKYHAENYPRHQVAQDQLQESEISAVSDRWRPDNGKCGGFCRDNRASQRPPRRGAAAQEIVAKILLATAEAGAKQRDAREIQSP